MFTHISRRISIILLVCISALLATVGTLAAAPDAVVMTKTILGGVTSAEPGDVITYRIDIGNTGGGVASVLMTDSLPSGVSLAGRPMQTIVNSPVNPINRDIRGDLVGWRGDIGNGGRVYIDIPVVVNDCFDAAAQSITNIAVVTNPGGAGMLNDSASLTVDCSNTVSLNDITWSVAITDTEGAPDTRMAGNRVGGFGSYFYMRFENTTNKPVKTLGYIKLGDIKAISLSWTGCLTCTRGTAESSIEQLDTETFSIQLAPNDGVEGWVVFEPNGEPVDNDNLMIELDLCKPDQLDAGCPDGADANQKQSKNAVYVIKRRDLGDAPDESNNVGSPMSAYPGVNAQFPTVFNPAAGVVQGPAHVRSGFFHLGMTVSSEREADMGADQDLINNIDPAVNLADQDAGDDGVRPNAWAFTNCTTTTIPVRVFIHPDAVTWFSTSGTDGYINAWVDSNRDGDWNDAFPSCGTPAAEHIIINHAIDVVALGIGVHTIQVPTTVAVGWPAAQANVPAWARVTLSEKVVPTSLNAGGVAYGDGRSDGTLYQTGETEDHLINQNGPILQAQLAGSLLNAGNSPAEMSWRLHFGNRGNQTASAVTIDVNLPGQTVDNITVTNPGVLCATAANGVNCTAASLPVGGSAAVTIRTTAPGGNSYTGDATVDASNATAVASSDTVDVPGAIVVIAKPSPNAIMGDGPNQTIELLVDPTAIDVNTPLSVTVDGEPVVHGFSFNFEEIKVTFADPIAVGSHTVEVEHPGGTEKSTFVVKPGLNAHLSSIEVQHCDSLQECTISKSWANFGAGIDPDVQFELSVVPDQLFRIDMALTRPLTETVQVGLAFDTAVSCDSDPCVMTDTDGDGVYSAKLTVPGAARPAYLKFDGIISLPSGETSQFRGGIRTNAVAASLVDAVTGLAVSGGTATQAANRFFLGPLDYLKYILKDSIVVNHEEQWGVRRTITVPGYQPRIDEFSFGVERDDVVKMTPVIQTRMDSAEISIDTDGFSPGYLEITPGTVVNFINADTAEHGLLGTELDSGVLLSGASYQWEFNTLGTFTYVDLENPENIATIVVTATPTQVAMSAQSTGLNSQDVLIALTAILGIATMGLSKRMNRGQPEE